MHCWWNRLNGSLLVPRLRRFHRRNHCGLRFYLRMILLFVFGGRRMSSLSRCLSARLARVRMCMSVEMMHSPKARKWEFRRKREITKTSSIHVKSRTLIPANHLCSFSLRVNSNNIILYYDNVCTLFKNCISRERVHGMYVTTMYYLLYAAMTTAKIITHRTTINNFARARYYFLRAVTTHATRHTHPPVARLSTPLTDRHKK